MKGKYREKLEEVYYEYTYIEHSMEATGKTTHKGLKVGIVESGLSKPLNQ